MKRKIYLYIADQLADLGDDTLVLMNYAFTDMQKPTAVKNSYSKQITLPGTPTNNGIFGYYFRPDRRTFSGFNALRRTPFIIQDELGNILQNGYLKLDSITRKGEVVTGYKITLYGGLGAFFYALAYDENGDKRTLASLDYMEGGPGELDFKINVANVRAAWARVMGGTPAQYNSIWDVINFAPAYNGIPDGDFDAEKALAYASSWDLETSKTEEGKTYTPNGGYVIVNLAQKHTEWDMKEFRSYLQRPILSIRAFLVAVAKWAEANGYTFDYSDIPFNTYRNLWKTLPTLPSLGSFKQDSGDVTATFSAGGTVTTGDVLPSVINLSGVQSTMQMTAKVSSFRLGFPSADTTANPAFLSTRFQPPQNGNQYGLHTIFFVQLQGYSGATLIAVSPTRCYADQEMIDIYGTPSKLAELAGFTPSFEGEFEGSIKQIGPLFLASNTSLGYYYFFNSGDMEVKGGAFSSLKLSIHSYTFYGIYRRRQSYDQQFSFEPFSFLSASDNGVRPRWWASQDTPTYIQADSACWVSGTGTASYRSNSALRSGALVEKGKLLSSKYTPTEYLISLGMQFGWTFLYDEQARKITVMRRNTFFNTGRDTIDLTGRIDRSKDITITPNYAGARIYQFAPDIAPGHFAEEYAKTYGFGYGIQRVDTGYQFDASPVDLLDKSVFRGAATILESGPYWNVIISAGTYLPSVFIDAGNTYTMWANDGTAKNFDVPTIPSGATITYINENLHDGYDNEFAWKLDLHDIEGKPVDGEDILVYYSGYDTYPRWNITDDNATMLALNNNKPCWRLYSTSQSIQVPDFHRYDTDTEWLVEGSLDFGTPREVDIPVVNFNEGSSAYERYWAAFIRDRYDQDTKVMRCRVDFTGIQVGPELLRRFFYYEGSVWVLNKITNYSLTTWDPVECEFVQVRDKANYTNGQNL